MRHLSAWWDFGTNPIGLVWTSGASDSLSGPINRPASCSAVIKSCMAEGFAKADGWFLEVDLKWPIFCRLNPMWKPLARPAWMYDANVPSGCESRN